MDLFGALYGNGYSVVSVSVPVSVSVQLICKVWVLLGATQEVRDEFARKRYGSQRTDEKR